MDNHEENFQKALSEIKAEPNIYHLSNVKLVFNEENFFLFLESGSQVYRFQLHPKHAKRMLLRLTEKIGEYEKKFGELKTDLPPIILDLGKSSSNEGKD